MIDLNSELLNNLLQDRFFSGFETGNNFDSFEIQVTSECNLKCEYCYLKNFGDKIYPERFRNHEEILKNLKILLDWIKERQFKISVVDIFSGEIWHTDFGIKILQCIYEKFKEYSPTSKIVIPSNGTFILHNDKFNQIKDLIEKFKKIDVRLIFSLSLDGLLIEDNARPFKDNNKIGCRDQDFYDKAFEFANEYNYGFHPMVSAFAIEKWIDNYKWWCEQFKKYNKNIGTLMMLEVRNDDWTDEKISHLLKFIDYVFDYKYNVVFKQDKVKMCRDVFRIDQIATYNNTSIFAPQNKYPCRLQDSFCVRLGDLAITPCHRTSYDKFNYGKFVVENGRITDIEANNVELAIKIISGSPSYIQHRCYSCEYKDFCEKGCLGAQYESNGELFVPCNSVCKMLKSKINFIANKCQSLGLFDTLESLPDKNIKGKIAGGLSFRKFISKE